MAELSRQTQPKHVGQRPGPTSGQPHVGASPHRGASGKSSMHDLHCNTTNKTPRRVKTFPADAIFIGHPDSTPKTPREHAGQPDLLNSPVRHIGEDRNYSMDRENIKQKPNFSPICNPFCTIRRARRFFGAIPHMTRISMNRITAAPNAAARCRSIWLGGGVCKAQSRRTPRPPHPTHRAEAAKSL